MDTNRGCHDKQSRKERSIDEVLSIGAAHLALHSGRSASGGGSSFHRHTAHILAAILALSTNRLTALTTGIGELGCGHPHGSGCALAGMHFDDLQEKVRFRGH